nr:unnamed protein product [Callosobruchus chinensis]
MNVAYRTEVNIFSSSNNFDINLTCFVLPKITSVLPKHKIDVSQLNIPDIIKLADPCFSEPQKIDMLIGSDVFWNIVSTEQISLSHNLPVLQNTKFGWIISGPLGFSSKNSIVCNFFDLNPVSSTEIDIQNDLRRFWEIEECLPDQKVLSEEEIACEKHFVENTKRNEHGAFVVKLPFKDSVQKLGDSCELAKRRLLNLEKRLDSNEQYKNLYCEFMNEYLKLGHMSKISNPDDAPLSYYMCHHGVYREDSLSTKLCIVFDGSMPSSTGYSINNLQMVGPAIQQDLFSVLIRFRKHCFVVAADIAKMYRCVFVSEEDRSLQRILWRFDKDSQIDVYELNTVTYGTAAASYLAIRCLFQLAHENRDKYPKIAKIIETDYYVDDLLTGCDTVEDLKQMSKLIHKILNQGCFKLRKFHPNNSEVLDWIVGNDGLSKIVNFNESDTAKTLGLMWCPSSDKLIYSVKPFSENSHVTKREILSGSSKIFDPLCLISPCIIQVKILLQGLWLEKVSWDDPLPSHIVSKWNEFKTDILSLNELSIDRHAFCKNMKSFELHIFSDSSEKAYGACIYVKTVDNFDNTSVNLLTAKARLAPLKSITIPRLELCGALLAARLTEKVSKALQVENIKRTFWTDSTIVLGWSKSAPNKLKTFVSNQVSEIQNLTTLDKWRHVPSEFNPADLVSRGIKPSDIQGTNLWWYGPEFLKLDESNWPENIGQYKKELPDVKKCVQNLLATNDERCILFDRFSDITKLTRIVAIMLRFKKNVTTNEDKRITGVVCHEELEEALLVLAK